MMRKRVTLASLGLVAAFLGADADAQGFSYGPQSCAAVTLAQSQSMEWRENGVFNRDPDGQALFVVCPTVRSVSDETFTAEVRVRNEGNAVANIDCTFREVDINGVVRNAVRGVLPVGAGESDGIVADSVSLRDPESYYSVTCLLPANTGIVALLSDVSLSGGSSGGGGSGGGGGGTGSVSDFNRQQSERMLGVWRYTYTIISTFTDDYRLTSVRQSTTDATEWIVVGSNQFGGAVAGQYSAELESWILLDPGTLIDKFYQFTFDNPSSTTLTGCYFQISPAGSNNLGQCRPLRGTKIGSGKFVIDEMSGNQVDSEMARADEAKAIRSARTPADPTLVDSLSQLRAASDR